MVEVVLLDARSIASVFPERFWIPGEQALAAVEPGMLVKVRALEVGPDGEADIWGRELSTAAGRQCAGGSPPGQLSAPLHR